MDQEKAKISQLKAQEPPANCPVTPSCPVCPPKPKFWQVGLKALLVLGAGLVLALIILIGSGLRITRKESLLDIWLASKKTTPTPETVQVSDPTAGWKIVSDGQVGVTFKYPDHLFPFNNKPIVSPNLAQFNFEAFSSQEKRNHLALTEADLQLEVFVFNPAKGNLEPYLSAIKTVDNAVITQPFPGITGSYIKVKTLKGEGMQTAVFYAEPERSCSEYDAIVMGANNKVATIRLLTGAHNKREQLLPILDQILSTFKFLDEESSSSTVAPSGVKILTYALPPGWKTIQDKTGKLEVGYDPNKHTPTVRDSTIELIGGRQDSFYLSLTPYNGGSRHQSLYEYLMVDKAHNPESVNWKMPSFHEKEYQYNNWSCLVFYGVDISQYPTTQGMCVVSKSQAVMFGIAGALNPQDEEMAEQTIRTIKVFK